jgi:hypothetical protein
MNKKTETYSINDNGIEREMISDEILALQTMRAEYLLLETEYKAKQKAREDAIKKLAEVAGLTEEEINAIL